MNHFFELINCSKDLLRISQDQNTIEKFPWQEYHQSEGIVKFSFLFPNQKGWLDMKTGAP